MLPSNFNDAFQCKPWSSLKPLHYHPCLSLLSSIMADLSLNVMTPQISHCDWLSYIPMSAKSS